MRVLRRSPVPNEATLLAFVFCCLGSIVGCHHEAGPTSAPPRDRPEVEEARLREPASSADDPVEICSGDDHTCVLLRDGRVACWGDNVDGQCSPERQATIDAPRLLGVSDVVTIYCGARETCVRTADLELHCLGVGHRGIEQVGSSRSVIDAVLYRSGGCLLQSDGRVFCWRLGRGPREERSYECATDALALAWDEAERRVCLRREGEASTCFRPEIPADRVSRSVSSIRWDRERRLRSTGRAHSCEIRGRSIWCRGEASRGQLGDGRSSSHGTPVEIPGLEDVLDIDAGPMHACALLRNGAVRCWGRWSRRRGGPLLEPSFEPSDMGAPASATELFVGPPWLTCIRSAAGWYCLGEQGWQRDGSLRGTRPGWLERLGARNLLQTSKDGTCGINRAGALICAVDMIEQGDRLVPRSIRTIARAERASRGGRFVEASSTFFIHGVPYVCGRRSTGAVGCYPLSDRDDEAPNHASPIEGLTNAEQLSAGSGLVCARTAAGHVECWGDDLFEQLGTAPRPPDTDHFYPRAIEALPPVVEVVSGGSYGCARTAAGRVWCWGSHRDGTATDGSIGASADPVLVRWPPQESSSAAGSLSGQGG